MQIERQLEQLTAMVSDIKRDQALTAKDSADTKTDVQKLCRIITGESEPERGLVLRLRALEQGVDGLRQDHQAIRHWAWSAIGSAIVGVGAFVWQRIIS
jgi:hypothetical protein